ncbi:hypothetical protein N7475_006544 [Penicillium sp. IBT 31633x]|nr:hypothetical protein N7475_006544 [Penicillium sp. IBT 31633x]
MPDPAELPAELFCAILNVALHNESNIRHFCNLALLNYKWHAALLGRIYNEWTYNGAREPFMTLLKFLRTIRNSAHIAALVQTLNVGNWGFYPGAVAGRLPSLIKLPPGETEWIRRAIHDTGLGELEDTIFQSLSQRDRRPLMAILLASVPNLAALYAHVPRSDPILEVVLERALKEDASSPLHRLKELYLFAEVPVPTRKSDGSGENSRESSVDNDVDSRLPHFKLDYLWPVFYLPKLRSLLLYDLDPTKAAEYLGQHDAEAYVEDLCLVGYGMKGIFTIPDFQALLTRTRLRSFSMYNPEENYEISKLSFPHMWDCLQKHKNTLQVVDIYRPTSLFEMGHFGLFRDFTSLKDLRIHIEMLLGGCPESPPAPFRLRETLPSTIQDLTLYGEPGYHVVPDMPEQLQELLDSGFPYLRSITLELVDPVARRNGERKGPYKRLGELCADKGIVFQVENIEQLSRGGRREELWEKSIYMQEDGRDRSMTASDFPNKFKDPEELLLRSAEEEANAAAEDGDEYSDSEDEYGPYNTGRVEIYTIPFTDHRGATAHMVFWNLESFPLPPLFSFAIYFTHPDVTPEHTDVVGFFKEIHACNPDGFDVRFDNYHLPSATYEDCIQHYQEEKASRGSYMGQVQMLKQADRDEIHPLPEQPAKIPGMVRKYHRTGQVLFICSDKDWREGRHALTVLKFGRSSHSTNTDSTPEFTIEEDRPMTQQSPAYDLTSPSARPVEDEMFFLAHRDRDLYLTPWQKATSRGWKGW